jgi:hypothetical protein
MDGATKTPLKASGGGPSRHIITTRCRILIILSSATQARQLDHDVAVRVTVILPALADSIFPIAMASATP